MLPLVELEIEEGKDKDAEQWTMEDGSRRMEDGSRMGKRCLEYFDATSHQHN